MHLSFANECRVIWMPVAAALLLSAIGAAQQQGDPSVVPSVENPAYPKGGGPTILVDGGHFNFHTADGRYRAFSDLLRKDGYIVQGSTALFARELLDSVDLLVISNALAERNRRDWSLPTPSAFSDEEIALVRDWVKDGGALLLIADHMPFPGAAEKLGGALGIRFSNGLVRQGPKMAARITFRRSNGSLTDHVITNGRTAVERVDRVTTFGGSAFQAEKASPLLVLDSSAASFMPERAADFGLDNPRMPVGGWLQGAAFEFGQGRVAVFGEAAMFTAQVFGPNRTPMGFNAPGAPQNPQFVLNVAHWLSGLVD